MLMLVKLKQRADTYQIKAVFYHTQNNVLYAYKQQKNAYAYIVEL